MQKERKYEAMGEGTVHRITGLLPYSDNQSGMLIIVLKNIPTQTHTHIVHPFGLRHNGCVKVISPLPP